MMSRERLSGEAIANALARHPGWMMADDGAAIARRFIFVDFAAAFGFMAEVALAAEKLDHHPDWTNVWNRVDVRITTHDRGGVTAWDFALAAACDRAAEGRTAAG